MVASGIRDVRWGAWCATGAAVLLTPLLALAQESSLPPSGGLDLQSIVTGLMGSVNVPVLAMLTVCAFAFHRIQAITAGWAIAAPVLVGATLGALSAVATANQTAGGWLQVAQLLQAVIEGAAVNGGMAVIMGRLASVGLEKLWPTTTPSGGQ